MPTPPPNPPPLHEAPANVYQAVYAALFWGMVASTALFALGVAVAASLWVAARRRLELRPSG